MQTMPPFTAARLSTNPGAGPTFWVRDVTSVPDDKSLASSICEALPRTDAAGNPAAAAAVALLAYWYAKGIYSSEAIETNSWRDVVARELCGHQWYSRQDLRNVRRAYRSSVWYCLKCALNERYPVPAFTGGPRPTSPSGNGGAVPGWEHTIEAEARQRLAEATLLDTIALDED